MNQNIKNFIEEGEKSIEKLAKNYADASYLVSEESHDEIEEIQALKQLKQFISSLQISLIKMIVDSLENYDLSVMGEDYKAGFKKCIELLK